MKHTLLRCTAALLLAVSSAALAQSAPAGDKSGGKKGALPAPPKPVEKDKAPPAEKPKEQPVTCTLLTKEAPRGGRLEVEGQKLGKSPVVKIGGVVTRIIERPGDKIAVQIPRKSDGGEVVVLVNGEAIACGTLTIIGLD